MMNHKREELRPEVEELAKELHWIEGLNTRPERREKAWEICRNKTFYVSRAEELFKAGYIRKSELVPSKHDDLKCPKCDGAEITPEDLTAQEISNVIEKHAESFGWVKEDSFLKLDEDGIYNFFMAVKGHQAIKDGVSIENVYRDMARNMCKIFIAPKPEGVKELNISWPPPMVYTLKNIMSNKPEDVAHRHACDLANKMRALCIVAYQQALDESKEDL